VAGICGGLPLALQIVAAQLKSDPALSAAELADGLAVESMRLEQLAYDDGSESDAPSVAAAFGLSYRELHAQECGHMAEYGTDYAQLCALVHALELRKPCPEMSQGAWGSLHGGSRKWFPEQSADPSPKERVGMGACPACRTSIIRRL
jgi:hypothetical protein